jgi:glycosyltransferase involved in cell wall biosynthesis
MKVVGADLASRAFNWDHSKFEHLLRCQAEGIEILKRNEAIYCAEISPIQSDVLAQAAVPPHRILDLSQPVESSLPSHRPQPISLLGGFLEKEESALAVTAVSRLDEFKNIDLFVAGSCKALTAGTLGGAIVIGGTTDDPQRRRLQGIVPTSLQDRFTFASKISHDHLVQAVLPGLSRRAIFVCSSRYDLVPYTALEAIRAGMTVISPHTSSVGISRWLPRKFLYRHDPDGLACALATARRDRGDFASVIGRVREATSDDAFRWSFKAACRHLSV